MESKYKVEPMRLHSLDERWFKFVSPKDRNHLMRSLKSLDAGRAPTPSFKLYGKSDVSLIDDFFRKVKASGLKIPEWQLEYEMSRKAKFGPQGGFKPWSELRDDFLLYYSRPVILTKFPELITCKKYGKLRCVRASIPATLQALIKDDKIQEKASGWNTFSLKKTDPQAQLMALHMAKTGNWKYGFGYTFSRFNKQKKRIFFPMPFCTMILEAQYYYPFLKGIQASLRSETYHSPYVFWADKIGFDKMFSLIVTPLCANHDPKHLVFLQRDFEKMDTTVGFAQTAQSFIPRLKAAFGLNDQETIKLSDLLYFGATCPIATPDGMYTGYRGKASGANTTNGDETCCNEDYDYIFADILTSLCVQRHIKFKILYSGGNGDDGCTIYYLEDLRRFRTFKKLIADAADEAAEICGYRVQGSKWFISNEYGLYCQRMITSIDNKIIDMYPAALIINSIVNPEQEYSPSDWDKDYRDLDIIEKLDNGKNLPYYHQLIDFVDNGMRFRLLGRSEQETRRILSKYERYRALRNDPFNYQDYDLMTDITKSPTIKYLLEKRHWTI